MACKRMHNWVKKKVCLRKGSKKHKRNDEIQPLGEWKNLPPLFILNKVGFLIKISKSKVTDPHLKMSLSKTNQIK